MITKSEINQLKEKLSQQFPMDFVEYIGCNRFVVRNIDWDKVENKEVNKAIKVILFNEKLEEISVESNVDDIYMCTGGLIRVSKTISLEGSFHLEYKKFGLIDVGGKELLPCEYDKANPKSDGSIELTRDGISFYISSSELIEGEYGWEDYKELYGKSNNESNLK